MDEVEGARSFRVDGADYDRFMGRYSGPLAQRFADAAGITAGRTALDVGCGPGALTAVLADRLGAGAVAACDPSDEFVAACSTRHPGVRVVPARAESLPFEAAEFDTVLAQLVLPFVSDPVAALDEFVRVASPGGCIGVCVWDYEQEMEMLRIFWDAALVGDPDAPDEARVLPFSRPGECVALFEKAGVVDVEEGVLTVASSYQDFDELWGGFLLGIGPAGQYLTSRSPEAREAIRSELFDRAGRPSGRFDLSAVARYAFGVIPS